MSQQELILALDQGTTSSRAIVFDKYANIISSAQQEFPQHYPENGWVEHSPDDIWTSSLSVAKKAFDEAEASGGRVIAIGITNQRETTLVWDRKSGKPIYNAIVWQDRRTAERCSELKVKHGESVVLEKTGLVLDPYFSATKISWILDNVDGARAAGEQGELAFGTVDSFILWRLTGGRSHKTDATNASRTNLFNIYQAEWDAELLRIFNVPSQMLPSVEDSAADFGMTEASLFGREIPICGIAGDQQAAAIGQCCFEKGDTKSTYGTGCFALMNTGESPVVSQHKMLTTVAYQIRGQLTYALEGSIFIAGAAVQWLRDELKMISSAQECEPLARSLSDNNGVYLVPAFTGLGAPYWNPEARGTIVGLTRNAGRAHIVRAALESVCYQTYDLMAAIAADAGAPTRLRVDGGMVSNDWLMQFLADVLEVEVDKPQVTETTALGTAFLAGLQAGLYRDFADIRDTWKLQERYLPSLKPEKRNVFLSGWQRAVKQTLS